MNIFFGCWKIVNTILRIIKLFGLIFRNKGKKYYQNLYFQKLLQVQKSVFKKGCLAIKTKFFTMRIFYRLQHNTTHTSSKVNSDIDSSCDAILRVICTYNLLNQIFHWLSSHIKLVFITILSICVSLLNDMNNKIGLSNFFYDVIYF